MSVCLCPGITDLWHESQPGKIAVTWDTRGSDALEQDPSSKNSATEEGDEIGYLFSLLAIKTRRGHEQ